MKKFKLATQTHLEGQPREDIRRDFAERMRIVPPDLRIGECVLLASTSEQNSARTDIWKKVEDGDYCCQRPHGAYQYWCVNFSGDF